MPEQFLTSAAALADTPGGTPDCVLNGAIDDSVTTITVLELPEGVVDGSSNTFVLRFGSELMRVTAVATLDLTVTRGYGPSEPAAHADGAEGFLVWTGEMLMDHGRNHAPGAVDAVVDYILIRDEKAANTAGGTFTSGAWRTRDLNTEVVDTGSHASVASNQITLAAGTYWCIASAPAFFVDDHQAKLVNVTDAADLILGTSEYSRSSSPSTTQSWVIGRFTIAAQKVIELQHRCLATRSTDGFGANAGGWTVNEVYSTVLLLREAD